MKGTAGFASPASFTCPCSLGLRSKDELWLRQFFLAINRLAGVPILTIEESPWALAGLQVVEAKRRFFAPGGGGNSANSHNIAVLVSRSAGTPKACTGGISYLT